jgi:hypothetical protein
VYCAALRVERESCCFSIDHALVNSNTNYNIIIIQFLFVFGVCVLVMEGAGGRYSGVTWAMVRDIVSWSERWGEGAHDLLRWWFKFFRSSITLKF